MSGEAEKVNQRLKRTRAWMAGENIDQLVVYSYRSALTTYWTGYCPRHSVTNASLVVITANEALHVTRLPLHTANAERAGSPIEHFCAAKDRWSVATLEDMAATARDWLGAPARGGRTALAAYWPEAGVRPALEQRFGPLPDVTKQLVEVICKKDAEDIGALRRAADVAQEAFDAGVEALQSGGVAGAAVEAAESVLGRRGSVTWHCFAGGLDGSGRSLLKPSASVLTPGAAVLFEVIPDIDLFCPEVVSTVFIREVPPEAERIHELLCVGLRNALAEVGPTTSFARLFEIMMEPLDGEGVSSADVTRLGHGTGLDNIELPEFIDPTDHRPLGSGRVLSIHPNVMTKSFGQLVRGGTVVVTERGCEPLFAFPDGPLIA